MSGATLVPKDKILFTVDIEGSGASISKHGIVSIGWCVGDLKGNVFEKRRVSLKLQNRVFEERCLTEYWSKPEQKHQLEVFQREAVEPYDGIAAFMKAVDSYEDKYDVVILSDNPAYDVAWLDSYIDTYLGRNPLLYKKDQRTYRGIAEPKGWVFSRQLKNASAGAKGSKIFVFDAGKYLQGLETLKTTCPHDHWPENDAENIYRRTLLMLQCF